MGNNSSAKRDTNVSHYSNVEQDEKKGEDDSIEELKEKNRLYILRKELKEKQIYQDTLAKKLTEHKDDPSIISWLSIYLETVRCDDKSFKSLSDSIDNCHKLQETYQQLRKLGIHKVPKFSEQVGSVLLLFQDQWKLLQHTVISLIKLSGKCELSIWAIDDCIDAINDSKSENKKLNTNTIKDGLLTLHKWIETVNASESDNNNNNTFVLENIKNETVSLKQLLNDWTDFKNRAVKVQQEWDTIKDDVTEYLKKNNKSVWSRMKSNPIFWCVFGGSVGYGIAHIGIFGFAAVACSALGIIGGILIGITIIGFGIAYCRKTAKQKKDEEKLNQVNLSYGEMLKFVEIVTNQLQYSVEDSKKIEGLITQLEHTFTKQKADISLVSYVDKLPDYSEKKMKRLENKFNEIRNSFVQFKANCNNIEQLIKDKQQKIINQKW